MVKEELARSNIDILGISELKWMGMVKFIQMTIISTAIGKNLLKEMAHDHLDNGYSRQRGQQMEKP